MIRPSTTLDKVSGYVPRNFTSSDFMKAIPISVRALEKKSEVRLVVSGLWIS